MTRNEEIRALRKLLWLNHGHTGQYGDDGEMQCAACLREYGFWDWKRTPVDEIVTKVEDGNLRKIATASQPPTAKAPDAP